ncbi:probable serine/threonine-protein kinase At1g54610 isoform X1 [Juglans microcarpa x Juglans regia]|uniref:probable serine/threonine-protein kinase At1g54610 isoform X1 n=1 Tax=Juglans microcarpa x Juglans regia TaxID=2249226 RepID=UPI001B7F1E78|nr:probable serine/threonine-protein kinase At1g54610 isoform X1 [Juglans microcarpa x Juglans regia]
MGCAVGKNSSPYSSPHDIERLKLGHGYVPGGNGVRPINHPQLSRDPARKALIRNEVEYKYIVGAVNAKGGAGGGGERVVVGKGEERSGGSGNGSKRVASKKIEGVELVDGWPKWLVDNVAGDLLAGLASKSADSYDKIAKVGQGTYSNVYKARDRDTKKIVALKKVRFDTSEPESVNFMAREILMLKMLDHPNIIKLKGLATSRMQYSLYLVFDFMQSDLTGIISRPGERLNEAQVKSYMQQLLSGLHHCHNNGILHRDIKPSNLLIDSSGVLKIADFGLANFYTKKRRLTSRVVTLSYRAPELLLGSTDYGDGIDLWSAGCVLAEMFVGRPIMPGRTEVEQLHRIFKLCGSPSEDYWKEMKLPASFQPAPHYKPSFEEAFSSFPASSFGLLTTLLALYPTTRGSAASALQSEFFTSNPLACHLSALPIPRKMMDESKTSERKKHMTSKAKQSSLTKHGGHQGNKPIELPNGAESHKEEKYAEPQMNSQEMWYSAISASSSITTTTRNEGSLHASLSPVFLSNKKISPKTVGHPNALKNIKNPTLLQASIRDIINLNEGRVLPHYRRSLSTIDFRSLDPEKISQVFGFDKDQAIKNN